VTLFLQLRLSKRLWATDGGRGAP